MLRLIAPFFVALILAGCAGSGARRDAGGPSMPPFPMDKQASYFYTQVLGYETYARSSDVIDTDHSTIQLGPHGPGTITWAMYQLNSGGGLASVIDVRLAYNSQANGGVYLAVADFATENWRLVGPFSPNLAPYTPLIDVTPDIISPLGNMYVAVIISNADSKYYCQGVNIRTEGDNAYPIPQLEATPNPGIVGRDTQTLLDAGGSSDSDGTIVRYQWDLDDDGKYEIDSSTAVQQVLVYDNPDYGNKPINLRVTDDKGSSAIASLTASWFQNQPPVALCQLTPPTGTSGDPVTLDATGSFDPIGSIAKYEWDMDADGTFEVDGGTVPTLATTLPATRQTVGLRVTDDMGETDQMRLALSPTKVLIDTGQAELASYSRALDMVLAAGHPALVYQLLTENGDEVRYIRALDPQGTLWGAPVILANEWVYGGLDLALIGGKPALAYVGSSQFNFRIADDSTGGSWAPAVAVPLGDPGYTGAVSLAEVAGNPALVFADIAGGDQRLRYTRAVDPQGLAWNPSIGIAWWGDTMQLAVVNGAPAVAYSIQPYDWYYGDMYFLRALDPTGDTWGASLDIGDGDHYVGGLSEISGLPVIAEHSSYQTGMSFLRGLDSDGSAWETVSSDDTFPSDGIVYSVANGKPVIASFAVEDYTWDEKRTAFYLYSAQDVNGDSWDPPQFLDTAYPPAELAMTGITNGAGYAFAANGNIFFDRVDL